MSLMKLLTVGRSFVAGRTPLGRYRMVGRRGGLPQFGPTGHSLHSAFAPVPARAVTPCQSELPKLVPNHDHGAPQTPSLPAAPTIKPARNPFMKPSPPPPSTKAGRPERTGPAQEAISRLRGWLRPKPARRTPSPSVGKIVRTPVQVHLKLASVQVVRNDLSDSDFEVRAGGGATTATAAVERRPWERLKRGWGGMSWSQATARWLQASRARVQMR